MENNNKLLRQIRNLLISIDSKIDSGDEPSPEPTPTPTPTGYTANITFVDPLNAPISNLECVYVGVDSEAIEMYTDANGVISIDLGNSGYHSISTMGKSWNQLDIYFYLDTDELNPKQQYEVDGEMFDIDTSLDYIDITVNMSSS